MAMTQMLTWQRHRPAKVGTTETVTPRRGNRYPIRHVTIVTPDVDYESEELPKERDPLTKRGWRRVIVTRHHPKHCGLSLAWKAASHFMFKSVVEVNAEWDYFRKKVAEP